jgi:hypothetical protein
MSPHSPEDGKRSSCVFWYLEFLTVDKVQELGNSECYTPLSESFGFYVFWKMAFMAGETCSEGKFDLKINTRIENDHTQQPAYNHAAITYRLF